MANRRMFSKNITDTDTFLDMPMSTQCLYFHLNMSADDDGFIGNAKTIRRMVGASEDDLKLLIAKEFIFPFESGVVVIRDWKIHNYIRKDRYSETVYQQEKAQIIETDSGRYQIGMTSGQPPVDQRLPQVRLGKGRLGKGRVGKYRVGKVRQVAAADSSDDESVSENAFAVFEKLWMFPNHIQREDLDQLINTYGNDLTTAAIKLAGKKDVIKGKALNFIEAALKEWEENNVKTIEQAREYQNNRNTQYRQNNWKNNKTNLRTETEPAWVNDPESQNDEKLSPEEEQAIRERMARIRAREGAGE